MTENQTQVHKPKQTSKYLIKERPLMVLPKLAAAIGLNYAIAIQQAEWLHEHLQGKWVDDIHWIKMTDEDWANQFTFWKRNTIRRVLDHLVNELKVLRKTSAINLSPMDRSSWYSIDYDALDAIPEKRERKKRTDYDNFGEKAKQYKRARKAKSAESPKIGQSDESSQGADKQDNSPLSKVSTMEVPNIGQLSKSSYSETSSESERSYIPASAAKAATPGHIADALDIDSDLGMFQPKTAKALVSLQEKRIVTEVDQAKERLSEPPAVKEEALPINERTENPPLQSSAKVSPRVAPFFAPESRVCSMRTGRPGTFIQYSQVRGWCDVRYDNDVHPTTMQVKDIQAVPALPEAPQVPPSNQPPLVPPPGFVVVYSDTPTHTAHLVKPGDKEPRKCQKCHANLGMWSQHPGDHTYPPCCDWTPKPPKAPKTPKPPKPKREPKPKQERKPSSDLTEAMWKAMPDSIRPVVCPYHTNSALADKLYAQGVTAERIFKAVQTGYAQDRYVQTADNGRPTVMSMGLVNLKLKQWEAMDNGTGRHVLGNSAESRIRYDDYPE
jgi:hypothetical protein